MAVSITRKATRWAFDRWDSTIADALTMPLFPTDANGAPTKAQFVETIEHLAASTGEPLQDKDGMRLYGGHTVRVTGAQTLAAHGIEVAKIRILARHSGDTILRYVSEAPLKTLRSDLGLQTATYDTANKAVQSKVVDKQLKKALARLDEQGKQLSALFACTPSHKSACYAQNLHSDVCHALRAGDAAHTACGWSVGPVEQRKRGVVFLSDIRNIGWRKMCDRCMIPERQAARLLLPANECEADSE
jgi:hypothetical protein